jgi:hypothetical protein
MPIYEFYSPDTHKIYSFYARRLMDAGVIPRCPDGPDKRMQKMISRFSFTGRAKEPSGNPGDGEGELDPRQEAAMMELAREMEGMGDAEPDPKTLGRMMRKMMDITGQKAPGEMEEMLRRLESGEDPEKLEEEFGPLMDEFDPAMEGDGEASGDTEKARRARWWRRAPARDPQLYEMADHLD